MTRFQQGLTAVGHQNLESVRRLTGLVNAFLMPINSRPVEDPTATRGNQEDGTRASLSTLRDYK